MSIVTKSPRVETTYGEGKPVYFVMVEGGQSPKRRHTSRYSATKEAERLAALNPGIPFNVIKLKQTMAVSGPAAPAPERVLDAADDAQALDKEWFKKAQRAGGLVEDAPTADGTESPLKTIIGRIRERQEAARKTREADPATVAGMEEDEPENTGTDGAGPLDDLSSYAIGRGIKDKTECGVIVRQTLLGLIAVKAIKTRNHPDDPRFAYVIVEDDTTNEEKQVNASRVVPIE